MIITVMTHHIPHKFVRIKCHTKPSLDSPKRRKTIKTLEEDMSIIDVSGVFPLITPEIEDLISCEYCDKDMDDQKSLKDHMMSIHGHGSEMKSPESVIENQNIKELEMVVECVDKTSTSPQPELKQSISICGECAKGFVNENECSEHMASHHVEVEVEITTPPSIPNLEKNRVDRCEICPFCNIASKDLKQLK